MPASNRDRQAARLQRYRAMKFTLETIRRECPDAATRRLADEALAGNKTESVPGGPEKSRPSSQ